MNINEILKLMDLRIRDNGFGVFDPDTMRAIIAHICELEARAETAEAKVAKLEAKAVKLWALLRPFISVAEWDIGESEDDEEAYQPMPARHAFGGVLRVKHFRAALKAMEATDE